MRNFYLYTSTAKKLASPSINFTASLQRRAGTPEEVEIVKN
jgi:hypothetical protein